LGRPRLVLLCRSRGLGGTGPGDTGSPEQAAGGTAWGVRAKGRGGGQEPI
jgi:hypothetical protein